MSAAATALRELWGLFVEDASLTLGILGCLLIAAFAFPVLRLRDGWRGPVLFGLLAIVLWENVRRATATRSPTPGQPPHSEPKGGH
ncbi:MAG: hypothetical protein QOK27_2515 [Gemmatimonadales bacterium]|nr:hypothetical protein [Gemmatimonadales bacterium]